MYAQSWSENGSRGAFPIAGFKGYKRFPSMSRRNCGAFVKSFFLISRRGRYVPRVLCTSPFLPSCHMRHGLITPRGHMGRGASFSVLRYSLTSTPRPGSAFLTIYSFSIKLAISIAAAAASAPLFPALVPARSIACSMVSVVITPKITGTPVSMEAFIVPLVVPEHT